MDFPGNSKNVTDKDEKPEKVVQKVISGEAVQRKKSLGRRFKSVFLGGEIKSVVHYIGADVLLPALRNLVVDTVEQGIRRTVYGESSSRRRRSEMGSHIQYNNPVIRPGRDLRGDPRTRDPRGAAIPHQPPHVIRGSRMQVPEIILISREEAQLIVEGLLEIVDKYEVASLGDLYDLCGLPHTYIDNKWGWSYLNTIEIRQVREGYLIELPPVEAI